MNRLLVALAAALLMVPAVRADSEFSVVLQGGRRGVGHPEPLGEHAALRRRPRSERRQLQDRRALPYNYLFDKIYTGQNSAGTTTSVGVNKGGNADFWGVSLDVGTSFR